MYIQEEEICRLSQDDNPLLSHFEKKNVKDVAYDLRVEKIYWMEDGEQSAAAHVLKSGDSVYVSTIEDIKLPKDMLGKVIPRNSSIRMGLDIASPVYRPGHHTKIFVRVTNIADNEIYINEGQSLFSIMFYHLSKEVTHPYAGAYTDEFDFKGVKGTHSVQTAVLRAGETIKDKVESVTRNIYATVLTLMSIFIATFSVILTNAKVLPHLRTGLQVIFYNIIMVGVIAAFVLMVSLLFKKVSLKIQGSLAVLFFLCLAIAIWLAPGISLGGEPY